MRTVDFLRECRLPAPRMKSTVLSADGDGPEFDLAFTPGQRATSRQTRFNRPLCRTARRIPLFLFLPPESGRQRSPDRGGRARFRQEGRAAQIQRNASRIAARDEDERDMFAAKLPREMVSVPANHIDVEKDEIDVIDQRRLGRRHTDGEARFHVVFFRHE